MAYHALARKWRPRNFHEVVGQKHVVTALANGLDNNRLHHAFLFTGTRGIGKTTLARILAKSLNCEQGVSSTPCGVCSICTEVDQGRFLDLIEIDAASRTKVEDTREILDNVQYAPTKGRYKVYLIDEVHMLSNSSFNALLKTLEEPPEHVKFILATTDPQKLPVTVLSRCLRFHLKKMSVNEIVEQLEKILQAESIPFEREALALIANAGAGSMRDALSLLDQAIAYSGAHITYQPMQEMLGLIDDQYTLMLLDALTSNEPAVLLETIRKIAGFGLDYYALLESLISGLHQLALLQIDHRFTQFEPTDIQHWQTLAEQFTAEDLQLYYQIALHGRRDLSMHPNIELGFEMTLLRMMLFTPDTANLSQKPAPVGQQQKKKLNETIVSGLYTKKQLDKSHADRVTTDILSESARDTVDVKTLQPVVLQDLQSVSQPFSLSESAEVETENAPPQDSEIKTALSHAVIVSGSEHVKQQAEAPVISPAISTEEDLPPWIMDSFSHPELSVETVILPVSHPEEVLPESISGEAAALPVESIQPEEFIADETVAVSVPLTLNTNEDWLNIVAIIPLEGISKAIARNLVFKSFMQGQLVLVRSVEDHAFHVRDAEASIARAVSKLLKQNVRCLIELVTGAISEENFDQRSDKAYQMRLAEVTAMLYKDPVVQILIEQYDGTLLEDTIIIT